MYREWRGDPFQHLIINNFFPEDVFEKIKKFFPSKELMDLAKSRRVSSRRYHFWLSESFYQRVTDPERRSFWRQIRKEAESLFKASGILDHFMVTEEDIKLSMRLVLEELPFEIPPHIDMESKLGTLVLYVECDAEDGVGTTLFSKCNNYFESSKSIDFTKNCGIFIPRIKNSWHGGRWQDTEMGERKTFHIYMSRT